jgi:hypothetical protein
MKKESHMTQWLLQSDANFGLRYLNSSELDDGLRSWK